MSTVWKLVIVIFLIVAAYFGYQHFANPSDVATVVAEENQPPSVTGAQTSTQTPSAAPERQQAPRVSPQQGDLAELEALANKEEEKKKIEEKVTLNEETGELIVSDPITGEVIFRTIVEPELIPLTKQNLELDFVTEVPDDPEQPVKEETVSVYPPESSGQAPEQVVINTGDDYEIIDVPEDSKALQFVESIPDDDQ